MAKRTFEAMRDELLVYDPVGSEVRLTDWEVDFLDDVRTQKRSDFTGEPVPWSALQVGKLAEIWERVFG